MTKLPDHIENIRRIAVPLERVSDAGIAKMLVAMMAGDGVVIVDEVARGHVAMVVAQQSGRQMVVFSHEDDMRAFATKFGLKVNPREKA